MSAPTQAIDLQSVRSLSHRLYCSCQDPSSAYRPLARSIRTLRNKLEEADEALGESTSRPEEVCVLRYANDSRDVLNRLEGAIQRHQAAGAESGDAVAIADLLNDVDEVTRKLSRALEALERLNGDMGLLLSSRDDTSTQDPRSPSILTTSSDGGSRMSTGPSSWSFISNRASLSHRLSVNSNPTNALRPEEEKQVVPIRMTSSPRPAAMDGSRTSSLGEAASWSPSFAYIDPLSVDIDSASSLIMGSELITQKGASPTSMPNIPPSELASDARPLVQRGNTERERLSPPPTPQRAPAAFHLRDPNNGFGARSSLQPTKPPNMQDIERPPYKSESVSSPLLSSMSNMSSVQENTSPHSTIDSPTGISIGPNVSNSEKAISLETNDANQSVQHQTQGQQPPSTLPARRPSHLRARALFKSAQAVKTRYRIVNPDKKNVARSDSLNGESWTYSPVSASAPFSPQSVGQESLVLPRSPVQHAALPTASTTTEKRYAPEQMAELDDGPVVSIIRSWNEGRWDEAKSQLQRLIDHQSEHMHPQINRRILHLLGVLASLQGEHEQALTHFLGVFETPIIDTHLLDVGHCAAAHWMGDIYSLLKRDAEAFLTYSIASRNPILQDSRREPLRACIFAERATTDQGARAPSWDRLTQAHWPEANDSISNAKIIDPNCARIITGTDIQLANKTGASPQPLSPNQSRAMALHNNGPIQQPTTWQEEHRLQLDAASLSPSNPWPMPYDPLFTLESVRRHRLAVVETDLLAIGLSATKIPKKTRLSFTCPDLRWLILTLRKCLAKLGMRWSETVGGGTPCFVVRYDSMSSEDGDSGVHCVRFFSIPLYRLSFRPGYGVEICPEGIWSSRIMHGQGAEFDKGVHRDEVKRVKKGVREFLEAASRRQEALEGGAAVMPVVSINGVTSLHRR